MLSFAPFIIAEGPGDGNFVSDEAFTFIIFSPLNLLASLPLDPLQDATPLQQ